MKILRRLIREPLEGAGPEDITKTGSAIGFLLDETTYEVFSRHREELLKKFITYVVPAVWGQARDAELDFTQKEIYRQIAPVVKETIRSLQLHDLNPTQEFALQYLVRGYVVSRLVFMIETFRGLSTNGGMVEEKRRVDILNHLEPLGSA